jgi:hypothetical protein
MYKVICTTLDAMAKDPHATDKALEHMGNELIKASNEYTAMSPRDKGHVIGKVMFGMINPEGSTEAGEAALKIADNVATHVDSKVMAGVTRAYEAAQGLSKTAPKAAGHAKQMLFDYASKLKMSPKQMQLAGIPEGYFDGMSVSSATAKGIDKSENMLAMASHKEIPGGPKIPGGGHADVGHIKEVSEAEKLLNAERAREHAVRIAKAAKEAEEEVTPVMLTLSQRSGGKMVGLKHNLKEVDSLTRKLELGTKPEDIKDALRYTMTFGPGRFSEGVKSVIGQMKSMGFDIDKVKNTFDIDELYKGVNCTFKTKGGQQFELQFHTPGSFFVKEHLNHDIYEVARELVFWDEKAGKNVLRQTEDLVAVAKKYHGTGKLRQEQHLHDMCGELALKKNGVKKHAQDFLNAMNKQMLDNYHDCEIPPGVNDIVNFPPKEP